MATLQVRIDDNLKEKAEVLFSSLGMDTSTAIRVFLTLSVENNGLTFPVRHNNPDLSIQKAIKDARTGKNLYGPYSTAAEAMKSIYED